MTNPVLRFTPNLSLEKIRENLNRLLVPGEIHDRRLEKGIARLAERFRIYATTYPGGLWAPGLAVTGGMRAATDLYLPMAEVKNAFDRFFSLALNYHQPTSFCPVRTAPTWLDALQRMQPCVSSSDPAALLRRLVQDESFRIAFLFTLFLPKRHGGNFCRYPGQTAFIRKWLEDLGRLPGKSLRCLDAACGTGETTYELALLFQESGHTSGSFKVHGSTIEPLELFAAAHIYFPHDPKKQADYRSRTKSLFTTGMSEKICFIQEDIALPARENEEGYDLILCNGLLGGPFVNTHQKLKTTVAALAGRLNPGGFLLAADSFHQGWKKNIPTSRLCNIFQECGLLVHEVADGIVATTVTA